MRHPCSAQVLTSQSSHTNICCVTYLSRAQALMRAAVARNTQHLCASTLGQTTHFLSGTPQSCWLHVAGASQPALTSTCCHPAGPLAAQNTEAGKTKKGIAAAEGAGGTPGRAAPGSSTRSPAFMSPTGSARRTPQRTPARWGGSDLPWQPASGAEGVAHMSKGTQMLSDLAAALS